MRVLTAALAAALFLAGNAAFAACGTIAEERQPVQTTAELPVLPPESAGS